MWETSLKDGSLSENDSKMILEEFREKRDREKSNRGRLFIILSLDYFNIIIRC